MTLKVAHLFYMHLRQYRILTAARGAIGCNQEVMNKVCSILLVVLGAIGFFASIFSSNSYQGDFFDDVVSLTSWILRIISLAIVIVGASNLIEINKRNPS